MSSPVTVDPPTPAPGPSVSSSSSAWPFSLYNRFATWRKALDLPGPGSTENLSKEAKNTFLTNLAFDGATAQLTKGLSMSPAFSVTHGFTLGSRTNPPGYNFNTVFANDKLLMVGNIDNEWNVGGRLHQTWNDKHVSKAQAQLSVTPGQSLLSLEHDYAGSDYSLNAKAVNASPVDLSGFFSGSYLQSITKNLAVGVEAVLQRPNPEVTALSSSYLAKYTGTDRNWIATAHLHTGGLEATYWQKLSEKIDVAAELQVLAAQGRRDAIAMLAARYDLRMASFRAQLDSTGKVSAFLEQRFAPTFAFLVSGEIDHFANSAKVGVGVSIESTSFSQEEMVQMGMIPPPPGQLPGPHPQP